jgi:TonB family protein
MQVAEAPQGHVIYPDEPDANLTGTVGLKAVIATDGRVKEIHVLSGNRILAEAAVQAVRRWRYTRHELNGEAVEAETGMTIRFHGQDAVSISFPSAVSNNRLALKANVAS